MPNLVVSKAHSHDIHRLASGALTEITQFGDLVGLATTATTAASMTEHSKLDPTDALLQGYRAAFRATSGANSTVVVIVFFALRKANRAGSKEA